MDLIYLLQIISCNDGNSFINHSLDVFGTRKPSLIPSRGQSMIEASYEFIAEMIGDNIGKEGMKYFSFIFLHFYVYSHRQFAWNAPIQFHLDKP